MAADPASFLSASRAALGTSASLTLRSCSPAAGFWSCGGAKRAPRTSSAAPQPRPSTTDLCIVSPFTVTGHPPRPHSTAWAAIGTLPQDYPARPPALGNGPIVTVVLTRAAVDARAPDRGFPPAPGVDLDRAAPQ